MEVRVVGPVEVVVHGQRVAIASKERAVLAVLVLARRRVVADDTLIDVLWRDDPPPTARKTLQGYVYRIRRALGTGAVQRQPGGYALGSDVATDVDAIEARVAEARAATNAGDHDAACSRYAEARMLVRGAPLGGLPDVRLEGARRALVEQAYTIEEEALAAELAAGRHAAAVGDLERLVGADGTRERAWAMLATAYAELGRQSAALDALARARRGLALELGVEPGARLRAVEQAILNQELGPRPASRPEAALPPARDRDIVGRAAEQSLLGHLVEGLHATPPRGGSVLIVGDPGIGKTALLHWLGRQAGSARVVSASGVESEAELSFAALGDLLRPLSEHLGSLGGPPRDALASALLLGPPAPADGLATSLGALELCRIAAAQRPLILLVDDCHWLDRASAQVLHFLCRRLRDDAILLALTSRRHADAWSPPTDHCMELDGLDVASGIALLEREDVDAVVVGALTRATGGNPMALRHAIAALSARQRHGADPLPDPVPLGSGLKDSIQRRLRDLPVPTQRALIVVACSLADDVAHLGATLAELDLSRSDLAPAEDAGIVRCDGDRARFTHPLLRSAAYYGATPDERRAAMRALAMHEHDLERRAWCVALAANDTDEQAAALLEQAADVALARNAGGAATAAYERAATIGDAQAASERLLRAAAAATDAGMATKAAGIVHALRHEPLGREQAMQLDLLKARIDMAVGDPASALRALVAHADGVALERPAQAAYLLANAALISFMPGEVHVSLQHAERAVALAERSGDAHARAVAAVAHAAAALLAGDRRPALSIPLPTYELAARGDAMMIDPGHFLPFAGRYDDARSLLTAAVDRCERAGRYQSLVYQLAALAENEFLTGNWHRGRQYAARAIDLGEDTEQGNFLAMAQYCAGRYAACTGDTAAARAHAGRALAASDRSGADTTRAYVAHCLGLAELVDDHLDAAVEQLEQARLLCHMFGSRNPLVVRWGPDLIEALVRSDRRGEADDVVRELEQADADAPDDWIGGVAARGRAMLEPTSRQLPDLSRSVACLSRQPLPFELARSLLAMGETFRALDRHSEARSRLREARSRFAILGAEPWTRRTDDALRALTPSGIS